MTDKTIEERVKIVIGKELCYDTAFIHLDHKLGKDLQADSLDISVLELELEEEFSIFIESKDFYRSMRVEDIVNLVTKIVNETYITQQTTN